MSVPLPNREEILRHLDEAKPLHAGRLAQECGVPKESYRLFVELLEQLVEEGSIARHGRQRYKPPRRGRTPAGWTGMLSVNPRGFGFVTAAGKPDVFIAAEALAGALHGDCVTIEVLRLTPKGTEGVVTGIVERRNPRVAGVVRRKRRAAWLEPDDTRVRGPIVLKEVGDAEDGEAAVAEITRYPEDARENPEGRIVTVLGQPGEPAVEVAKIKAREQIEEEHPPQAMREAEALAVQQRRLDPSRRRDLRHVPFLTIDPVDARDHDDAIWAEKTEEGFRVYIGIADVSEYVQPGTALNEEALKRGCTIYLPDRAIPMLPGLLAADLCSLLPDQDRYCMCVIVELDRNAVVRRYEVVEGLMRAAAMISYESVARTLGYTERPALSPLAEAFKRDLKVLATVSGKLRRARLRRGALDLDLPEAKVELDDQGAPTGVHQRAHDPGIKRAYQMVEEMMLLANEVVARWLAGRKSPAVYRVHGKPDEEKLARLGLAAEVLKAPFEFEELLEPKGVGRWLKKISKHPKARVLEGLLLRSLQQAVYDIVNIGHFGLASDAYLHFTSPIRRYPDLLVHRSIKALLRGGRPDVTPEALEGLRLAATTASQRERAAMSVEREVVDLYRALFMRDHLGEMYEGVVTAIVGGGVFVNIAEPFIDVLLRFESLGSEPFEVSDDELAVIGRRSGDRINLGDTLTIVIEDVSLLRRTIYGHRIAYTSDAEIDELQSVDAARAQRRRRAAPEGKARQGSGKRRSIRQREQPGSTRGGKRTGRAKEAVPVRKTRGKATRRKR